MKDRSEHCSGDAAMFQRAKVVHRRHAARGDDGKFARFRYVLEQSEIAAGVLCIEMNRGDEQASQRNPGQVVDQIEDVERQPVNPTARHDASLSNVGREDEQSRKKIGDADEPVRLIERSSGQNNAARAGVDQALDLLRRLHASADLNLDCAISHDLLDDSHVRSGAGFRVAIDDLKAMESVGRKRASHAKRITRGKITGAL